MKIERVETFVRDQVAVVRVRTDSGIDGIGQTAPYRAQISAQVLHDMVAPVFLGQDPWNVEALVDDVFRRYYKFTGGFLQRAVTGIETALWDILGKDSNQPVMNLIGGCQRPAVPVYGSSMVRHTSPKKRWNVCSARSRGTASAVSSCESAR